MNPVEILTNNRILIVDDNPAIHEDILKILGREAPPSDDLVSAKALLFGDEQTQSARRLFQIDAAFQGEEALQKVKSALDEGRPYAVAFIDIRMPPGWDGIETMTRIWRTDPHLQAVICTAYSDYSWDEMVQKIDHADNFVILKKPFDNIEVLQLAHALAEKWELHRSLRQQLVNLDRVIAEQTSALAQARQQLNWEAVERAHLDQALNASKECFAKLFQCIPAALALQSPNDGCFIEVNRAFLELTGYVREDVIGRTPAAMGLWIQADQAAAFHERVAAGARVKGFSAQLRTKTGVERALVLSTEPFCHEREVGFLTVFQETAE